MSGSTPGDRPAARTACLAQGGYREDSRTLHPPTSGSWLILVEVWFGVIERLAIRRGSFTSDRDLMMKIRQFITGWNDRKPPSSGPSRQRTSSTRSTETKNESQLQATSKGAPNPYAWLAVFPDIPAPLTGAAQLALHEGVIRPGVRSSVTAICPN
jgi:hypothetical protein